VEKYGEVSKELQRLATLYWTPKTHKSPLGQRFIASSRKCVTKPISQLLSKCLKTIQDTVRRTCGRKDRRKGVNGFWIVNSTDEVLDAIQKGRGRKIKTVSSFDFSTLYTMIDLESLKKELRYVLRLAFGSQKTKKRLSVFGQRAKWTASETAGSHNLGEEELADLIDLLVDNIYVVYGGQVYKQDIGIPMGTDCAPFLANLYLFALEHQWISKLQETGQVERARNCSMVYRYIDDLLAVDDDGEIGRSWKEIYPSSLILKKENADDWATHFLDLNLTLNDGRINLSLYDKRDDFPFVVRSFPDLSGNVHFSRAHGVIVGQLYRFAKANDQYPGFRFRVRRLNRQLMNQGFSKKKLEERCGRVFDERPKLFGKYRVTKEAFVRQSFWEQRRPLN
jgi:hypothetical protein